MSLALFLQVIWDKIISLSNNCKLEKESDSVTASREWAAVIYIRTTRLVAPRFVSRNASSSRFADEIGEPLK